jgi:hypothetical protein
MRPEITSGVGQTAPNEYNFERRTSDSLNNAAPLTAWEGRRRGRSRGCVEELRYL